MTPGNTQNGAVHGDLDAATELGMLKGDDYIPCSEADWKDKAEQEKLPPGSGGKRTPGRP